MRSNTSCLPSRMCSRFAESHIDRSVPSLAAFRTLTYALASLTAAATFAASVHGVVVQINSSSPGRSMSGKVRNSPGCVTSA